MNKHDAMLQAFYAASLQVDTSGAAIQINVKPEWIHLDADEKATRLDYEHEAERLFDLRVKRYYMPDVLYLQQCEWMHVKKIPWAELDEHVRTAFMTFAALATALHPLIDVAVVPPARPAVPDRELGGGKIGDDDDDDEPYLKPMRRTAKKKKTKSKR